MHISQHHRQRHPVAAVGAALVQDRRRPDVRSSETARRASAATQSVLHAGKLCSLFLFLNLPGKTFPIALHMLLLGEPQPNLDHVILTSAIRRGTAVVRSEPKDKSYVGRCVGPGNSQ